MFKNGVKYKFYFLVMTKKKMFKIYIKKVAGKRYLQLSKCVGIKQLTIQLVFFEGLNAKMSMDLFTYQSI